MESTKDKEAAREASVYTRPKCLLDVVSHYCGGCGHGTLHKLLAEVIDELDIRDRAVGVAPVGCAVLAYNYIDIDWSEAAHGRPPAVATGLKRVQPDRIVFTYQGDGDLASIGMAETIHSANRGENITVIFVNNGVYAMTQGQMAPTTPLGEKTKTTPRGRDPRNDGYPIKVCELLSQFVGTAFLARTTLTSPAAVRNTKRTLKKAFRYQMEEAGFCLVEVLSPCPTYWHMTPSEANIYIDNTFTSTFPLGVIKDVGTGAG